MNKYNEQFEQPEPEKRISQILTAVNVGIKVFVLAILLLLAKYSRADSASIYVGYMGYNAEQSVGAVAYTTNTGWRYEIGLIGEGDTKYGYRADQTEFASISKLFHPIPYAVLGGIPYVRLGVSVVNDHVLVGDTNFIIGTGIRWRYIEFNADHISSAGIYEPNAGLNYIGFRAVTHF